MIDINKMRRLAQSATPGPWKACRNHECYEGAYFEIDPEDEAEYAAKPFTHIEARTGVVAAAHDLFEFDREDAEFIAAANPAAISELLDRLEAAEKDVAIKEEVIDSLAAVVKRLDAQCDAAEKERDDVAQQLVQSERGKRAISEECDALRNEIAYVKEVEFPRKAQAVADAWKGKCKRLEVERDALRAKTTEMEKQAPIGTAHAMPGAGAFTMACFAAQDIPVGAKLYALPGAKGE